SRSGEDRIRRFLGDELRVPCRRSDIHAVTAAVDGIGIGEPGSWKKRSCGTGSLRRLEGLRARCQVASGHRYDGEIRDAALGKQIGQLLVGKCRHRPDMVEPRIRADVDFARSNAEWR